MTDYTRLAKAPMWCVQYPTCSACCIDLETDGDGWTCPGCGTQWDMDASDGDRGELYADWAGEESTGPILTPGQAADRADYLERLGRHRRYGKEYPALYPEPRMPDFLKETS